MIGLIIYLVGSVMAYRKMKRAWLNDIGDINPWSRVVACFSSALISWLGFLIAVMLDPEQPSVKPPKWL
jgi:hypothetical protein